MVLAADRVGKIFCQDLHLSSSYALRDMLNIFRGFQRPPTLRPGEFYALKDISFELHRGATLGVLGFYRSGKSTLANILGGLYPPDEGTIRVAGSCVLVNNVGSGFRTMLSVWENTLFKVALMGAPRDGLEERCRTILDFAELTGAEQKPLFNLDPYHLRQLGLSIALHIDAEIMIFDGVLKGGGDEFRDKSTDRLRELLSQRSGVLITTNRELLEGLADRVLVLYGGRAVLHSSPKEAFDAYDAILRSHHQKLHMKEAPYAGMEAERSEAIEAGEDAHFAESASQPQPATADEIALIDFEREERTEQAEQTETFDQSEGEAEGTSAHQRQAEPPIELRRRVVNGEQYNYRQLNYLFYPGDRVEVELYFAVRRPTTIDHFVVGILPPFLWHPLMETRVGWPERGAAGSKAPTLKPGDGLQLGFSFAVPRLQLGRYGLCVAAPEGEPTWQKRLTHKVMIFQVLTDAEPGRAVVFDLDRPQLERQRKAVEISPAEQQLSEELTAVKRRRDFKT